MTVRCCWVIRGVSQPEERVATTRRALGSMLAVDEERRERAGEDLLGLCTWLVMDGNGDGNVLLSATEYCRVIVADVCKLWRERWCWSVLF